MHLYTENDYFGSGQETGYADYHTQEESLRQTFRRFLGSLRQRGLAAGSLLEVGCGYGYFLDEAKPFFRCRTGLELSERAASEARRLSGAKVYVGDVSALPVEAAGFDLIVLINVIEHVYEPRGFLSMLHRRLGVGGCMIIATPDIGSFWYKLMGRRWPSFKIPEHVAYYTRSTLESLMRETGHRRIEEIPFPHAFPLGLIAKKLGLGVPAPLSQKSLWLPHTMVALSGRASDG
jgi:SAM-dependent methyltransferase